MGKIKSFFVKTSRLLNYDFENHFLQVKNELLQSKELINSINNQLCNINNQLYNINKQFNYSSLEVNRLNNTDKIKVLICGFYGAFNYGDELMLNRILDQIDFEKCDITIMLCDKKNIDITKYRNVSFVHYPLNIYDLNILAQNYDCLIFGGGALIDDTNYNTENEQMTLGYILINLTLRFITFNKKTILYGLSSNTVLNNKEYISKLDYIVNNCTYISFRDKYSVETLKAAGIIVDKIKIVDDLVFGYDYSHELINKTKDILNVGFALICFDMNKKDIYDSVKNIIDYYKKNKINYKFNFIVFYSHEEIDYNFYSKLVDDLNIDSYEIIDPSFSFEKIKKVFLEQDIIFTMRYHASLISNMLGVNTVTINLDNHRHYHNKLNYLFDNYKFEKKMVSSINSSNVKKLLQFEKRNIDIKSISSKSYKQLAEVLEIVYK